MGITSIKCESVYAKGSGFGKGYRSSSDFDGTDFLAAAGMMVPVSLASGCISLSKENVMRPLVKNGDFEEKIDYELKATKVGDTIEGFEKGSAATPHPLGRSAPTRRSGVAEAF